MTTEPAKRSHDRFIDRTISPPINADPAKGTPSNKIRPGVFAKAEISGLRFGYAAPGGPSAPVPRAPPHRGRKTPPRKQWKTFLLKLKASLIMRLLCRYSANVTKQPLRPSEKRCSLTLARKTLSPLLRMM